MSNPSLKGQVWALLRRYHVTLLQSPFSSVFRIFIWPGLLIGLSIYFVISLKDQEYGKHTNMETNIPLITLLITLLHVRHLADWLVTDKATGIKSLMISMGLKRNSYYLGNFICALELFLPLMLILCVVSLAYLFEGTQTSSIAILMIYLLFVVHLSGFIFAFTSAINSPSFVSIVVYLVILILEPQSHWLVMWMMKNTDKSWWSLILFAGSMSPYESLRIFTSSYVLCKNCDKTDLSNDLVSQPVYLILVAMTFWIIVAFAFARWFDEVCPWQNVTAVRSPLFCLKSSRDLQDFELEESPPTRTKYFENPLTGREVGIRISNITKTYKSIPVVDNISFNIYKGETTLLLGHNGAGKTTLMSLILGKLSPDKGRVQIRDNYTMLNDRDGLGIGVCPQTSILDDNLTVRQHLDLFLDIKSGGMSSEDRDQHVLQTITDVSLFDHRNKRPTELSGGMKRKLSLAMAFVGNSSILILDEPSSGLDPDSRVFVWDAIRRYRSDRTVLLSTQHMEEADYLGDRIAIMKGGKIICCGSSMFLNNVFGTGYKLRVACPDSKRQQVIDFVGKYFESAKLEDGETSQKSTSKDDPVKDLMIELLGDRNSDLEMNLIQMLEKLESPSTVSQLDIRSFGLKSSSIEDVLLSTTKDLTEDVPDTTQLTMSTKASHVSTMANPIKAPSSTFLTNQRLFLYAFVMKHVQTYRKRWITILFYRVFLVAISIWSINRSLADDYRLMQMKLRFTHSALYSSGKGFFALVAHLIYFPTLERTSKFKIIQLSSHANYVTYWLAHLVADSITVLFIAICFNLFLSTSYSGDFATPATEVHLLLTISIILFGIASALLSYILSFLISNAKRSVGYHILLMLVPSGVNMLTTLIGLAARSDLSYLQNLFNYIFVTILPSEAIQYIIFGLGSKCYLIVDENCVEQAGFSPVVYGSLCLLLQVVAYAFLLHLIESNNLDLEWYMRLGNLWPWSGKAPMPANDGREIDRDVVDETSKAIEAIDNVELRLPFSLVAADLNKTYYRNKRKAVDHLSFTVNRGECFGLLGVNGAGKTSTFSMLVAESKADSGRVWLNGRFSAENVDKYRRRLGFDPQSSPEMSLSPVDALHLMARLRRLNERSIPMLVSSVLELLDMSEHARKSANQLSGGTKRKLSLAMSLIGNPSLLALDEPTAGVDPIARRSIWQLLRSLRSQSGSSIIISSHAMEECEAICDRISIMARGRLRCIGTFLHLKSKFARGSTIRVQISGSDQVDSDSANKDLIAKLNSQLQVQLGSTSFRLVDTHVNGASFSILDGTIVRSRLFKLMREFRQSHESVSYTINDSSLEDIFIALAREQQQLELSASSSNLRQQMA